MRKNATGNHGFTANAKPIRRFPIGRRKNNRGKRVYSCSMIRKTTSPVVTEAMTINDDYPVGSRNWENYGEAILQ